MTKSLYLKVFVLGIMAALFLSSISLYCLVRISEMVVEDYRYGYLLYIGRAIEKSSGNRPVSQINVNKYPAPPIPKEGPLSLLKVSEAPTIPLLKKKINKFGSNGPSTSPSLWLISTEGKILSSTSMRPLPILWEDLPIPKRIHGMRSSRDSSLFRPKTFVVKLDTNPTTYLVSHNERSLVKGPFLWIQGIHTFMTAALAVLLALSISFYYLRRKSTEARKVLGRLEAGDLKARFEIKRFDEFGSLILDFNRMAQEIERLVNRLNETESSRTNLLQELGHDLRTPLTSLRTSFETLRDHSEALSDDDKAELHSMISEDIRYFTDLLEKLTTIATINRPFFTKSAEKIDLVSILEQEMKARRQSGGESLHWYFGPTKIPSSTILGDPHLITRLFKNAFDNAARYAASAITVNLKVMGDNIEVLVLDDGPGLTIEMLDSFGRRRERRIRKEKNITDFSLGLGSVIMKTIAEVHGGRLEMSNNIIDDKINGACLRIVFNKV